MTNEEIMKVVKPAVCSRLKCPASAQFPMDMISITGDDKNGYRIEGFVDSQNSYGAMMRDDFTSDVKVKTGVPIVISTSVGAKSGAARTATHISYYIYGIAITIILYFICYYLLS